MLHQNLRLCLESVVFYFQKLAFKNNNKKLLSCALKSPKQIQRQEIENFFGNYCKEKKLFLFLSA